MSGHAENVDPASADFHDKEDVESAQRDGVEGKEIGGQQPGGLGMQEGSPAGLCSTGCGAETGGGQDSPDRACAYAVSEAGEFTLEAAVAPGGIFVCQAQDQLTDLLADRRAA
jgi:hypothetical protein